MAVSARKASRRRTSGATQARDQGSVAIAIEGGCLTATLSRRGGNRISVPMAQQLMELAETVEDDSSILAFLVTGSGSQFCSGFDDDVDARLVETLALIAKPTVAVINGDAFDEGLELAMGLDIRATTAKANFALRQLRCGTLPHFGGTQRLPRLIGATHALQMILTGDPMDGEAAMRLGLVTYLAADARELARVGRELGATLASRGTFGVRMVKDAVRKGSDMTLDQGIRLEEDLYALLQTTADRAEGVRAFLEKRKPLFKGA